MSNGGEGKQVSEQDAPEARVSVCAHKGRGECTCVHECVCKHEYC